MNGFIFASGVNQPGFPNDAVGSFRPGATWFKKINGIKQEVFYFDYSEAAATKRQKILAKLRSTASDDDDGLDVVAYFGHGIQGGLASADIYKEHAMELAYAIAAVSKNNVRVVLYSCSSGALVDSFAGALAQALGSTEACVFGHTSAKHAFANPDVTVFNGGSTVGSYVVDPSSGDWSKWKKAIEAGNALDPSKNPLWATFPFMGKDELGANLGTFATGGVSRTPGRW
jgi:hypothetical protein